VRATERYKEREPRPAIDFAVLVSVSPDSSALCQQGPSRLIVIFHVIPPVLFGVIHGARIYRSRGILVFAALCRGVGARFESVSVRTGFPFGHQGVIALHSVQRFRMMT